MHPLTGIPGPQSLICVRANKPQRMVGGSSPQVTRERAMPDRLSRSSFDRGRTSARAANYVIANNALPTRPCAQVPGTRVPWPVGLRGQQPGKWRSWRGANTNVAFGYELDASAAAWSHAWLRAAVGRQSGAVSSRRFSPREGSSVPLDWPHLPWSDLLSAVRGACPVSDSLVHQR